MADYLEAEDGPDLKSYELEEAHRQFGLLASKLRQAGYREALLQDVDPVLDPSPETRRAFDCGYRLGFSATVESAELLGVLSTLMDFLEAGGLQELLPEEPRMPLDEGAPGFMSRLQGLKSEAESLLSEGNLIAICKEGLLREEMETAPSDLRIIRPSTEAISDHQSLRSRVREALTSLHPSFAGLCD